MCNIIGCGALQGNAFQHLPHPLPSYLCPGAAMMLSALCVRSCEFGASPSLDILNFPNETINHPIQFGAFGAILTDVVEGIAFTRRLALRLALMFCRCLCVVFIPQFAECRSNALE